MIIKVIAAGAIEIENVKTDTAKSTIEGSPLFYGSGSEAVAFIVQTYTDDNKLIATAQLRVSGKTGRVSAWDKTTPVKPQIERPKVAPKPPEPPKK